MQLDRFTVSPDKINFAEVTSAAVKFNVSGINFHLEARGPIRQSALEQLEKAGLHKIGASFVNIKRMSAFEIGSTMVTMYFDGGHEVLRVPVSLWDENPVPTSDQKRKK